VYFMRESPEATRERVAKRFEALWNASDPSGGN